MSVELTEEQLEMAETRLKRYLPLSQQVYCLPSRHVSARICHVPVIWPKHVEKVYGCLVLRNRVRSDPVRVLVDRWPEFSVIICKPQYEQDGDLFKDTMVFANDEVILKETMRQSSVIDWTKYLCVGMNLPHMEVCKAVASEKGVSSKNLAVCHMMRLEDISNLPSIDSSSGITLSSLDESHVDIVNQTWKFGENAAVRMLQNMLAHFPSCCVLDAEGQPVSWILTYETCAMGVLYTLPEHRGKGYAKIVVSTMAKRLFTEGYPVFCCIEEDNKVSYKLFKNLGFTEDPSFRATWYIFNDI